jgi:hypothetical protein
MDTMSVLMTVWAVLTTVLAVLLIYRGTLHMHEDDQIFLDNAEAHLEREQQELMLRVNRIRPYVNGLAVSSGVLVLLMAGLWVWQL